MKKRGGLVKYFLTLAAIATFAANCSKTDLTPQKIRDAGVHEDTLAYYQDLAKTINNGRIETHTQLVAMRDELSTILTYEQLLVQAGLDVDEKVLGPTFVGANKLVRFSESLSTYIEQLHNGRFKTFAHYVMASQTIKRDIEAVVVTIEAFEKGEYEFPLFFDLTLTAQREMERVANQLADAEQAAAEAMPEDSARERQKRNQALADNESRRKAGKILYGHMARLHEVVRKHN